MMIREVEQFYLTQEEPNKSCFLALRSIILNVDTRISETINYGMPCFCYHKRALCYLWKDKKTNEPYLLMVDGKDIEHPKLEQGKRARMKILRIPPMEDISIETIHEIVQRALSLVTK